MADIPKGTNIENGQELMSFQPSGPPKGSGKHRYAFLLFSHDAKIGDNPAAQVQERRRFKVKEYMESNVLGTPKFVNFYYSENP